MSPEGDIIKEFQQLGIQEEIAKIARLPTNRRNWEPRPAALEWL